MRFVDTNIFLRFLINDVPHQANACEALFRRTVAGEEILLTNDMVIAEIIWVLEPYYELSRSEIRDKVQKILNTENLECPNKEITKEVCMVCYPTLLCHPPGDHYENENLNHPVTGTRSKNR